MPAKNIPFDYSYLDTAKEVFESYSESLKRLTDHLDARFDEAIHLLANTKGRVILIGVGKSGIIGKKIAATFASTGTTSFFVHAGEAYHGDLGMIHPEDIAILTSYSGETEEVIRLIPLLKKNGTKIISIVGQPESTLATHSDIALHAPIEREVCPNNLAPTTSTLVSLAMGDALAVCLMKHRGFKAIDFAKFHPGGSLGRRLLTTVEDVMRTDNLPILSPTDSMREVVWAMTKGRRGMAIILEDNTLCGVVTDGDLRRALVSQLDFTTTTAAEVMTTTPQVIHKNAMLVEAEEQMTALKISSLIVEDDDHKVVGVVQIFAK